MPRDETGKVVRVDAAGEIVPSGDRAESARVVSESCGVLDARRLRRLLAKSHHSLDRVMKPPRRAEQHRRIMTGQRGKLTTVGRLVQREHDEPKALVIAVGLEQWAQIARKLRRNGNVATAVGAITAMNPFIVIAQRSGM